MLDGISLWDFDYIDLGRVRMPSFTVPVTIKSLVFSADPRIPHAQHHHAHHGTTRTSATIITTAHVTTPSRHATRPWRPAAERDASA